MTFEELTQLHQQLPQEHRNLPLTLWHAGQLVSVQGFQFKDRYAHGGNPPALLLSPYAMPTEQSQQAPPAPQAAKK